MSEIRCPNCDKKFCNALDGQVWFTCKGCKREVHINTRHIVKKIPVVVG